MPHAYDTMFMDYTARMTEHAANSISRLLLDALPIASVLDVGCARGTWLSAWSNAGVGDILGVDGNYVATDALQIPADCFRPTDLSYAFNLPRQFDLVQSLEVAEHIPKGAADQFVENLVTHAKGLILFSAAPPGQGGEFHVNEQPYEYWRAKFQAHGFDAYDYVRPLIAADKSIPFWYRYNMLLYVHRDRADALPTLVRQARVLPTSPICDRTPTWFRLRKYIINALPFAVQQSLAHWKARHKQQGV